MKTSSEKYDLKKEQIIEAAQSLFAYYGYSKTTLDEIAQKVGIKKNSIYYYFESKEALLNMIISNIFDSKVKLFEEKSVEAKNTLGKLKLFLKIFVTHKLNENKQINITPGAYLEIIAVIEKSFNQFLSEAEKLIVGIIDDGINNRELRKHDSVKTAKVILEFTRAMEYQMYSNSDIRFIDNRIYKNLENKVMQLVELSYFGLKA